MKSIDEHDKNSQKVRSKVSKQRFNVNSNYVLKPSLDNTVGKYFHVVFQLMVND